MSWHPVNRNVPCAICKKSKNGYCMFSDKGEFLCMRVESNRPLRLKTGEVGWVHKPEGAPIRLPEKPQSAPVLNVGKLMGQFHAETNDSRIPQLAQVLGVKLSALQSLGCAWSKKYHAWAIPNFDGWGNMVGISLRSPSGFKWMVPGSHIGLFMPTQTEERLALICEGASDTAAALSLGFFAIGRHNASSGAPDIRNALRRYRATEVVIISHADEIGSRGAVMFQKHLPVRSALIVLPAKDLRAFTQLGGTRELLDSLIENLTWENP